MLRLMSASLKYRDCSPLSLSSSEVGGTSHCPVSSLSTDLGEGRYNWGVGGPESPDLTWFILFISEKVRMDPVPSDPLDPLERLPKKVAFRKIKIYITSGEIW